MSSKQAACLTCRRSKIKCKRELGSSVCAKCAVSGGECVIPNFHVGRQKGVKNKRTGLDKAVFQIAEALKKSKSDTLANEATLEQLRQLLDVTQSSSSDAGSNGISANIAFLPEKDVAGHTSDDQLALDDAENPLQLLARASDLRLTSPSQLAEASPGTPSDRNQETDIQRFFQPMKANIDQSPEWDPIEAGLVTLGEAEMLMTFFHEKLAHTRWGMDPVVHTLSFVRNRSAFLFTSVLTASSRFVPGMGALSRRLLLHRLSLAQHVIAKRLRSVEIVLAFIINVPWMHPQHYASDDDTGVYIGVALSIALDLSLNKIVTPSWSFDPAIMKRVGKADCIDARKALATDGFEDIDPTSEWGQRLLRRRERAWFALFVLERGVCLARGRSYSVPITPLVRHCDHWHLSEVADPHDGAMLSMIALRRDLDGLFSTIRSRCDSYRASDDGANVARDLETMMNKFFNEWLTSWTKSIGEGEQKTLPPYVEILVTHTRLSTYSGVMNHPTAPSEVKRLFRASALSSALNVMRAAIQGEARLMSMPNNTVIMISFAACVALSLSTPSPNGNQKLAPSVRNLIEEVATVMERIGSTPSHRNGISILYGKYLRELVKQAPEITQPPRPAPTADPQQSSFIENPMLVSTEPTMNPFNQTAFAMPEDWTSPLQFSTMSPNELTQTVMDAADFEAGLFDITMEDPNAFAFMDWMNPPDFGFQ
ncbi:hypothetical protein BU24DRAFT_378071 [Aaosphaeria arxii CBS 175.79]|uniref:Zn(2)-C6 fungal-type domain-containing protein n=1 Tax=Aaosphaeria arxii CBS 175.79 TaxID=1450172 RepID=A0A6A5XDR7_9PLEO|nr:uncharacterized protein BU24DRAFT_378071 [Aaosphaeria arxii CBS 175.79]KAF2011162.1 hypothetical protein BU24DRAFT_378071 [Aaosphaeria arxii CBS 175.79]